MSDEGWAAALDAVELELLALELADPDAEEVAVAAAWVHPALPAPPAALAPRAHALLARIRREEERLSAQLAVLRDELEGLAARRHAAARYDQPGPWPMPRND